MCAYVQYNFIGRQTRSDGLLSSNHFPVRAGGCPVTKEAVTCSQSVISDSLSVGVSSPDSAVPRQNPEQTPGDVAETFYAIFYV